MEMIIEQFDRMDLFSASLNRPTSALFQNKNLASKRTSDPKFFGTDTYEDAMALFNNGWDEKAEEIRRGFVNFELAKDREVSYEKTRPATSVVGFAPHVPNAIIGLPNSMIYTERTPMKSKAVRIIYNMTANSDTRASDIMNAGLTVLKIVNSLERKGFRVRIDVTPKFSEGSRQSVCCMVCIKDWRQPLDIKKVAFPISHPSMFRRLGFRWMETNPNITDSLFTLGYGSSFEDAEKATKILRENGALGDNDHYINVSICKSNHFDVKKTAEAIGIKNI